MEQIHKHQAATQCGTQHFHSFTPCLTLWSGEQKQKPANKHRGSDVCKTFDKPWILSLSLHQKRRRFPIGFSPLQYKLTSTPKSNFHWPEYKCII